MGHKSPTDIPTQATARFVSDNVRPTGSLIEVGCGEGDLTALLTASGFDAVGIDSCESAVTSARNRGRNVFHTDWLEYHGEPADAILFSRSLHHIHPLKSAVDQARQLTKPGGILLVEDFDRHAVDEPTLAWFQGIVKSAAGLATIRDGFVAAIADSDDLTTTWHDHHCHDLHSADAMTGAVGEQFGPCITSRGPYLYRYLHPTLPPTGPASNFLQSVFDDEENAIRESRIQAVGLRLVAPHQHRRQ